MSTIPGVTYRHRASGFTAPDRATLPIGGLDRHDLVRGTFLPNNSLYSGLEPGWTPSMLDPVFPGSSGQITYANGGLIENKLIWATALPRSPDGSLKFKNCLVAGRDPREVTGGTGCIKAYGTGYYQFEMESCVLDPGVWKDPTLASMMPPGKTPMAFAAWNRAVAARINGIHGGRCTLRFVEIKNVADCFQETMKWGGVTDTSFILVEDSWLHGNAYYRASDYAAAGVPSDGNHADGAQLANGRDITFRGVYFGGPRDLAGYSIYDPTTNPSGVSYNSGDDAYNAEIMIAQITSLSDTDRMENILVEQCYFEGGKYGINQPMSSTLADDMDTIIIRDNFFVRRADGKYVIRNAAYASHYTNNKIIDLDGIGGFTVGSSITYTNG